MTVAHYAVFLFFGYNMSYLNQQYRAKRYETALKWQVIAFGSWMLTVFIMVKSGTAGLVALCVTAALSLIGSVILRKEIRREKEREEN